MDPTRFDALARALAAPGTRRRFVAGLAAGALGALGLRAPAAAACRAVGGTCREHANCCSALLRRQGPERAPPLRLRDAGRLPGARPVPRRHLHRRRLRRDGADRPGLRRRQPLHHRRNLPGQRHLRRRDGDGLPGARPVPPRRRLRSRDRVLHQPGQAERDGVRRRGRLHPDRHLPGRGLHREQPGRLHGTRRVPRRGDVRPAHRRLLRSGHQTRRQRLRQRAGVLRRRLHRPRHRQ